MRNAATSGGALLLCLLALTARADQVEYSFPSVPPPSVTVAGGGQSFAGYRLAPGGTLAAKVKGPGVLRLLYFQDYIPGKPFPADAKLMVTLDGQGKMSDLAPRPQGTLGYSPSPRDKARPSEGLPIMLKIEAGEHPLVVKLPGGAEFGGVVSFANAKKGGDADDLDLDLAPVAANTPKPKGGGDLDLPDLDLDVAAPAPAPAKGDKGKKAKAAQADNLDLDLDLAPAPPPPAKGDKGKPAPVASLDLDLDIPPVSSPTTTKPAPVAVKTEPVLVAKNEPKPKAETETILASQPKAPPSSTFVAVAPEPVKKPKHHKERPPPPPPEPEGPPPQLGSLEVGVRAGWALARDRLRGGEGLYLAEVGYRLAPQGGVRVTFTTGYSLLSGSWTGFEPGMGKGGFIQNTTLVPLEVGITWEPGGPGGVSPYLGIAFAGGVASTSMQRYSLKADTVTGPQLGATGQLGLRIQAGTGSFVFEVRHTEAIAALKSLGTIGQPTLSATALTGGYLFSF